MMDESSVYVVQGIGNPEDSEEVINDAWMVE